MIEIDPNEGSGVIPLDWRALLQPKDVEVRFSRCGERHQISAI